jgi:murein DD-endopeptidase MepM/ murein hydrolase activator NlpD
MKQFWGFVWPVIGLVLVCQGEVLAQEIQGEPVPVASMEESSAPAREPFIDPIVGKKLKVVSSFGKRHAPAVPKAPEQVTSQSVLTPTSEMHEGVDYAAQPGATVRASRDGKVIFAGSSKMYVSRKNKTEQKRLVILRHADGMSTRYVNLSALKVRPGSDVVAGQVIGTVAASDEVSQPVLHFEIRDMQGKALDPVETMAEFSSSLTEAIR